LDEATTKITVDFKPKYSIPEPPKHIGENFNPNRVNSLIPMTLEGKDSMIL